MNFIGTDNQTVELKIINYQYPENKKGDWDGNWLLIYLDVKSKLGSWETVDPSLTTWEVKELVDWFNTLANNRNPEYTDLSFTEPNLSFKLLTSHLEPQKKFRIVFSAESQPKSASDEEIYFVECLADDAELKRLGNSLQSELDKYPQREKE